ncbi:MAG: inorganic phosphate transporter [Simkaniaceae bacterium]|nr:inorganic phosphate transporter [Simkaniaceae bacterium]
MSFEYMLMILILVVGFYMAWNIGANDVANAMGTSVGSGALTLVKAVVIAGVLEFCGAFFLGNNVSQTLQRGLINPAAFAKDPQLFLLGMFSALLATALWLQLASYFGWPVSTTHAIVGSLLGFGILIGRGDAIDWGEVGKIALSWLISPVLSALFAFLLFTVLQRRILFSVNPVQASKELMPYLAFVVAGTFTLSVLWNGIGHTHVRLSPIAVLLVAFGAGLIGAGIALLFFRKKEYPEESNRPHPNLSYQVFSLNKALRHLRRAESVAQKGEREMIAELYGKLHAHAEKTRKRVGFYSKESTMQGVEKMFASLQIVSACYVAFAHGANDVANAIGPVAAATEAIRRGHVGVARTIPPHLLALGGAGIVVGLATWGWRVMETIGRKITALTPTRGFSAEFGAAFTILIASKLGLPISTTHCIVGAVLGVGLARGISALNLRVLKDIALSWVITLPSSAIACIVIFYLGKALLTAFSK